MKFAIIVDEVSYSHFDADEHVLQRLSLSVPQKEVVALLGPSGAGKTTLLTLLDGRLKGWNGHVSVLGKSLNPDRAPPLAQRTDTGFIFQEFALEERSTVLQNVLNGRLRRMGILRGLLSRPSQRDREISEGAITDCGIADLADRRVDKLSSGQRQRVAIARCLAHEPRLILADEPVSNLDPVRAVEVHKLLDQTARKRGITMVFSSHQPELARRFADRIIGIRDGRIVFDKIAADVIEGTTNKLYEKPDTLALRRLQVVND